MAASKSFPMGRNAALHIPGAVGASKVLPKSEGTHPVEEDSPRREDTLEEFVFEAEKNQSIKVLKSFTSWKISKAKKSSFSL